MSRVVEFTVHLKHAERHLFEPFLRGEYMLSSCACVFRLSPGFRLSTFCVLYGIFKYYCLHNFIIYDTISSLSSISVRGPKRVETSAVKAHSHLTTFCNDKRPMIPWTATNPHLLAHIDVGLGTTENGPHPGTNPTDACNDDDGNHKHLICKMKVQKRSRSSNSLLSIIRVRVPLCVICISCIWCERANGPFPSTMSRVAGGLPFNNMWCVCGFTATNIMATCIESRLHARCVILWRTRGKTSHEFLFRIGSLSNLTHSRHGNMDPIWDAMHNSAALHAEAICFFFDRSVLGSWMGKWFHEKVCKALIVISLLAHTKI